MLAQVLLQPFGPNQINSAPGNQLWDREAGLWGDAQHTYRISEEDGDHNTH